MLFKLEAIKSASRQSERKQLTLKKLSDVKMATTSLRADLFVTNNQELKKGDKPILKPMTNSLNQFSRVQAETIGEEISNDYQLVIDRCKHEYEEKLAQSEQQKQQENANEVKKVTKPQSEKEQLKAKKKQEKMKQHEQDSITKSKYALMEAYYGYAEHLSELQHYYHFCLIQSSTPQFFLTPKERKECEAHVTQKRSKLFQQIDEILKLCVAGSDEYEEAMEQQSEYITMNNKMNEKLGKPTLNKKRGAEVEENNSAHKIRLMKPKIVDISDDNVPSVNNIQLLG